MIRWFISGERTNIEGGLDGVFLLLNNKIRNNFDPQIRNSLPQIMKKKTKNMCTTFHYQNIDATKNRCRICYC